MRLKYDGKKSEKDILSESISVNIEKSNDILSKNKLFIGDNYYTMKYMLNELNMQSTIDLVYIDPPFSTNTVFRISDDKANAVSSIKKSRIAYEDTLKGKDFIEYLRKRIILIRELMSETGSFYLHIDYKIGHYVKIILDEIFGIKNFRNDITRIKCNSKNFKRKAYGNIKDLILFYTKSKEYTWNEPKIKMSEEELNKLYNKTDSKGRKYTTNTLFAPGETVHGVTGKAWRGVSPPKGRHWMFKSDKLEQLYKDGLIDWSKTGNPRQIIYADEKRKIGKKLQDIWNYKDPQYPEYPTQKNKKLIDLIISTSSNENDLIMDCFAGSGTTIFSASRLNRNWIGIEKSEEAIKIIINRLSKTKRLSLFHPYSIIYEMYMCH